VYVYVIFVIKFCHLLNTFLLEYFKLRLRFIVSFFSPDPKKKNLNLYTSLKKYYLIFCALRRNSKAPFLRFHARPTI